VNIIIFDLTSQVLNRISKTFATAKIEIKGCFLHWKHWNLPPKHWNKLSEELVESLSLEVFNKHADVELRDMV